MTEAEFREVVMLMEAHWHLDTPAEEVWSLYWHELRGFERPHVVAAIEALARSGQRRMPLAGEVRRKLAELHLDAPSWAEAIRHYLHVKHGVDKWTPPERCLDGNPNCNGEGWVVEPAEYDVTRREPCECSPAQIDRTRRMSLIQRGETEPCPLGRCDGSGFVLATEKLVSEAARHCSCWNKVQDSKFVTMHAVLRRFIGLVGWSQINDMLVGGNPTVEAQLRVKYDALVRDMIEQDTLRGLDAPGLARIERANEQDGERALPVRTGQLEPVGSEVTRAIEPYRG